MTTKRTWTMLGAVIAVVLPVATVVVCRLIWPGREAMRMAGGVLELLGVVLVGWGLAQDSWSVDMVPSRAELLDSAKRTWYGIRGKPLKHVGASNTAPGEHVVPSAAVPIMRLGPHAPIHDLVAFLENELQRQEKRLQQLNSQLGERMDREHEWVHRETEGLKRRVAALGGKVRGLPAEKLGARAAGAWWLFCGIIAQTWL